MSASIPALDKALRNPIRLDAAARIVCPVAFQVRDENTANDVPVGPVTELMCADARRKVRAVVEALTSDPEATT